jgi:hypothetical protein
MSNFDVLSSALRRFFINKIKNQTELITPNAQSQQVLIILTVFNYFTEEFLEISKHRNTLHWAN